jgi:hypothetical protein
MTEEEFTLDRIKEGLRPIVELGGGLSQTAPQGVWRVVDAGGSTLIETFSEEELIRKLFDMRGRQ